MLHPVIIKSPTRPTSIRTLCGAIAPVPAGCPHLKRVLPSRNRTACPCGDAFLARAAVTRTRRFALKTLRQADAFFPGCSATVRTPPPSPTAGEARSPVSAPPPPPLSSWHSFLHVRPASTPPLQIRIRPHAAEIQCAPCTSIFRKYRSPSLLIPNCGWLVPRLAPPWPQPQITADVPALLEPTPIFHGQYECQRDQRPYSADLLQQCRFRISFRAISSSCLSYP